MSLRPPKVSCYKQHAFSYRRMLPSLSPLRNLQRQANFLPPALSLLESKKRFILPPDPSNTRIQGAYADIWQQSSQILGPARYPSRSQSSLEFRSPTPCPAHAAAAPACQQRATALDHKQQVLLLLSCCLHYIVACLRACCTPVTGTITLRWLSTWQR